MSEDNSAPISSRISSPADAAVGVVGITAQAVAGDAAPQPFAEPAAGNPANPAPNHIPAPTGAAPADPVATHTATPGLIDKPATEQQRADIDMALGRELSHEARATIVAHLNAVEQLALYWGGETGTKIRNYVGKMREQLQ